MLIDQEESEDISVNYRDVEICVDRFIAELQELRKQIGGRSVIKFEIMRGDSVIIGDSEIRLNIVSRECDMIVEEYIMGKSTILENGGKAGNNSPVEETNKETHPSRALRGLSVVASEIVSIIIDYVRNNSEGMSDCGLEAWIEHCIDQYPGFTPGQTHVVHEEFKNIYEAVLNSKEMDYYK